MSKYDLEFVPNPFGFINLGATCYFNSLLQSIISCPILLKTIMKHKDEEKYKENLIIQDLIKMHEIMISKEYDENLKMRFFHTLAPTIWKKVFTKAMQRKDNIKFSPGQECAREGFHLFLEALDGLEEIQKLFLHRYQTLILCEFCNDWVVDKKCEYSLFEIQPNLKTHQHPRFKEIDPHYNKERPLLEFLNKQNSYVDEDFRCPKCNEKGTKFQTTRLIMIPEILVVLSKKYDMFGRRKSYETTPFPENLEFSSNNKNKLNYKAVSRIEHMGNMGGGHYNCHSLRKDGNWYKLDDSQVSPGSFISTPNTYLVFYHIA